MQSLFAELAAILRQEIDLYRQLLALVRRERGRIIKGELAGLSELVRRKEALARELAPLEESRVSLLERLASELGEPAGALTLLRVAERASGEAGEALRGLLGEFRGIIGRLVAAHEVNRNLLDRSLEFVQGSLDLFRTVVTTPASTYGASGRLGTSEPALVAVNQIA